MQTARMRKRLQIALNDRELDEIRRSARKHHVTTAAWVRHVLQRALRAELKADTDRKLAAIRAATAHTFPATNTDRMLQEIERGYLKDSSS
jgi:hypothetical protein